MNKSLLTIGIVLSLGSVGCAGFGVQQSSSLAASYTTDRGVDDLWMASEEAAASSAEPPLYADQTLGDLWGSDSDTATSAVDEALHRRRSSDLWNTASPGYQGSSDSQSRGSRPFFLTQSGEAPSF